MPYDLQKLSEEAKQFLVKEIRGKRIIEIGHGQSKLMGLICQQAGIEYYGIEPRSKSCWEQTLEKQVNYGKKRIT